MQPSKRIDDRNTLCILDPEAKKEAKILAIRDGQSLGAWTGQVIVQEIQRRKEQERVALVG